MTSPPSPVREGLGAAALGLGRPLLPWLGCGLPRGATDSPPVAPHPGPAVTRAPRDAGTAGQSSRGEASPGVRSSAGDCLGARAPTHLAREARHRRRASWNRRPAERSGPAPLYVGRGRRRGAAEREEPGWRSGALPTPSLPAHPAPALHTPFPRLQTPTPPQGTCLQTSLRAGMHLLHFRTFPL